MQQLERRFYTRQEIAEVLAVNPKDSNHFARNVKTKLENWGYAYNYSKCGVEITAQPETPEERLKEILIRKLNMDVQIDPYAFACFICAFQEIGSFASMPWEERAIQMKYKYEVDVTDRTLRSWCRKLIGSDIIQKCGKMTFWKTEMFGNEKVRTKVTEDDPERERYNQKKMEYLEEGLEAAAKVELKGKMARNAAWNFTYKSLWRKFHCCYYTCSGLLFNGIGEEYLFEIYELVEEIAAAAITPPPDKPRITTKEEFHEAWYNLRR